MICNMYTGERNDRLKVVWTIGIYLYPAQYMNNMALFIQAGCSISVYSLVLQNNLAESQMLYHPDCIYRRTA